jgi:SAM-dependent methyltransferase
MASQRHLLGSSLPSDHSRQTRADHYVREFASTAAPGSIVLDLGCGLGRSRKLFGELDPTIRWLGVDLPNSPEVNARRDPVAGIASFDGIHLPLRSSSIDGVFSQQVLEHVRHPEALLHEVNRVLRSGGVFFGSTSHLEPYHSRSLWNFTPFGFKTIVEDAGFVLEEIRPGIDGITLIQRSYTGDYPRFNPFFASESPLNSEIESAAEASGTDFATRNDHKLGFCGHFSFRARSD